MTQGGYSNLPSAPSMDVCCQCNAPLHGGDSPWSVCFDPCYKSNVWGGDTHEVCGLLCQKCAASVTGNAGMRGLFNKLRSILLNED